jgi:RNA polymerase sigma factor (sigma-70 family)
VRKHEGLIHTVVWRQAWGGMAYGELLQAGRVALWKAVLGFNPEQGVKFSSYAGTAIRYEVWRAAEQANRPQGWQEPQEEPNPLAIAEDRLWRDQVWMALAEAVSRLPDRQREVIMARCGWDGKAPRTFKEIGQEWGMSHQAVHYWYSRALISLRLPAISGRLRRLWGQNSRESYIRSQKLSRTWLRQRRPRRGQ